MRSPVTELLLGDEAVALAALDAGIAGAFSYPGTPSTEIFEFVQLRTADRDDVSAHWSANEKVAFEEAMGMSYAGRRALVSMKHVGLNVAADPFMSSALTGANGGLVLAVADDPGMHSSQNEQDSRYLSEFGLVPLFEPADQQECYDATLAAFELSEQLGTPVMVRLVTRLAHSRAIVHRREDLMARGAPGEPLPYPDWKDWTLLPVNARRRYAEVVAKQPQLAELSDASPFNKLELSGHHGVIAAGIAINYVKEVLGDDADVSLLKLGTYPLPVSAIRRLVDHCDDVLVVEEGYPFIESRLNGLLGLPGKAIRGRLSGDLPRTGELSTDAVARALGRPVSVDVEVEEHLAGRPPRLCRGCPHTDTYRAIGAAAETLGGARLFGDIGCYTLGALPPLGAMHTCVDMGASISLAHGASQAGVRPVLAIIGDSTFIHSGMTPLIGAVRRDADMTVIIADNETVAMTGTQQSMATGGELVNILRGLGVDDEHLHMVEPIPKNHGAISELLEREMAHPGLSVIVARRECIQATRRASEQRRDTADALS